MLTTAWRLVREAAWFREMRRRGYFVLLLPIDDADYRLLSATGGITKDVADGMRASIRASIRDRARRLTKDAA